MKHGESVAAFESAFAEYVHARYAIAMTNGTSTIQVGLLALGLRPGDRVSTTALTMAATTIAILNAGGIPVYEDVDPHTWLWNPQPSTKASYSVPVSLYGLHWPYPIHNAVDDAAQTLRPHGGSGFTSYSLQRSKVLQTGEGGVLVTNDEALATAAREIGSLGYKLGPSQSRIDSSAIKSPDYERHHRAVSLNARMNDLTAAEGLRQLDHADRLAHNRRLAAHEYRQAIQGCPWITPQAIPDGCQHDMWTFAVALHDKALWHPFTDAIVRHGGEMPYGAWKLSYQEPVFRHLTPLKRRKTCPKCGSGRMYSMTWPGEKPEWQCRGCSAMITPVENESPGCPIAEDLQPRLCQMQTNDIASAERNAEAVYKAILEIGGTP